MNTANELLKRTLEVWDDDLILEDALALMKDIRTYLSAEPEAEPVAWMFQHEDTGLIDFVDTQQVEWGFEKNNPRWQKIGPVYLHPPKPAELEAEPVGEIDVFSYEDETLYLRETIDLNSRFDELLGQKLYIHPPKPVESEARKPMTDEEIWSAYRIGEDRETFFDGIRFAEKHHGIGGDDPETGFGMTSKPHEWQGLDEDEIEEILEGFPMGTYSEQAFAQAIEQALKEKNT